LLRGRGRGGVTPEPGSRSKETILFMVPGDEDVFGTSLAAALEGRALWMDSPGWGEQAGAHRLLRDALDAGHHVQAFLRVTDDAGVPTGPGVQYLASRVWRYENGLVFLRDGRLAYKWFPGEDPDWLVERFNALIRLAWQQLVACTTRTWRMWRADRCGERGSAPTPRRGWGPSRIAGPASGRPTGWTRCDLTTAKAQSMATPSR
jgi:hypothetical protein